MTPLDDAETLVKVVRLPEELIWVQGGATLAVGAFRKEDLRGENKSVSVMRLPLTPTSVYQKRARDLSRSALLKADPILAFATAKAVRTIYARGTTIKCCCAFADPILPDENDELGPYLEHASVVKKCDYDLQSAKSNWTALQQCLVGAFSKLRHLSGASVGRSKVEG